MSIEIFVSYADTNKDERMWKALEVHLTPFYASKRGSAYMWNPHKNIIPGFNRKKEISKHLQLAQIFLLLLSPDYFADEECISEIQHAISLNAQTNEQVYTIPVLLRSCQWQRTGLNPSLILPYNKVPVSRQKDPDEVWVQVLEEIQNSIDMLSGKHFRR